MDLKQINYFMWVYEERSFSRAAAKANVVQSALSMQIRRIEDEFGVLLFNRLPRGVEPTEAGRKLYERCVPITRNLALAREELSGASDLAALSGVIRVGLPGSFNRGVLCNILLPFMERYPDVRLTISEAYTGTLIDWVREGSVDFALGVRPSEEGGLIQKLIYRDRVVLMSGAPVNGPSFSACNLSEAENLKLILPAQNQSFGSLVQSYIDKGQIRAAKTIEINGTVRVVAQTSFADGEGGIEVDGQLLTAPYTLDVIGDPDTLSRALDFPGGFKDDVTLDQGTTKVTKLSKVHIDATRMPAKPAYAQPGS